VRLYTRNAYDWTARLPAIAAAAQMIRATSFAIGGEAVVLGSDGLSRFDELRHREAAQSAMLYAFDLIEHDGQDLDRKGALARLLRDTEVGILLNEHVCRGRSDGVCPRLPTGGRGCRSKRIDCAYRSRPQSPRGGISLRLQPHKKAPHFCQRNSRDRPSSRPWFDLCCAALHGTMRGTAMAVIEAAVTTAVVGAWETSTLAERHREMAEEYHRLSTINSSAEVRSYNLRMAEHYSLLADVEKQGARVLRR
jgi:hypothetical protein